MCEERPADFPRDRAVASIGQLCDRCGKFGWYLRRDWNQVFTVSLVHVL
jgi:hypothetical protein